mgnify:CR=1 FL=1
MSAPIDVSVVIPSFNAETKIGRCLASLRAMDFPRDRHEVIFVDDASEDGTCAVLEAACASEPNWQVIRLDRNSGSPSEPRNRGLEAARGEFVFFLDSDDEISPDTLRLYHDRAVATGADIVRGNILVRTEKKTSVYNRIDGWRPDLSKPERIALIVAQQSTNCPSLIRTELLRRAGIAWRSDLRMGEDTLFLIAVLSAASVIEYLDHQTFTYNKQADLLPSSTQVYGHRELNDHLTVWTEAQAALVPLGLDYVALRLNVGLKEALLNLIFRNRGDVTEADFARLSAFVGTYRQAIETFPLAERLKELLAAITANDWDRFRSLCRPRMVIAGYDLKFILPVLPELEPYFDIRVDEWRNHNVHDRNQSRKHLEWAELIWCEWLMGAAVWYAAHKRSQQKLIVRAHRFELDREFGEAMALRNVDAVVAVSVHYAELLLRRFPGIRRERVRLIPNYVQTGTYRREWDERRLTTLGLIGILPARKGFRVALEVLSSLRERDPRFRLDVFGNRPEDVGWILKDPVEADYFRRCEWLIDERGLRSAVSYRGFVDVKSALSDHHIGFVLSTSDSDPSGPGPESFHVAIADGFAAGGIGLVLRWSGAEYVWPQAFQVETVEAMVDYIDAMSRDADAFQRASDEGRAFVSKRYDSSRFVTAVRDLCRELA